MEIFCFFLGVLYTYTFHLYLPATTLLLFYITPRYPIILFFLLGFCLAWGHQWFIMPRGLPNSSVIQHATIQGRIASIPQQNPHKTQFVFELEQFNHHPAQGLVQLAWYTKAPKLQAGQHWQFSVKLKKPRNFLNPGSADYVTSLNKRHIIWTGYIRTRGAQLIKEKNTNFDWVELRASLGDKLTQLAPNQPTAGIIEALTLNLTRHISQESWELFRRTGTTHLFGISGEHIALISGLVYWLSRWLWSRSSKACLYIPAPYIASSCGLFIALFYAFLAGFEPPVQRALIGCFFYAICSLGKQRFTPWQIWRYALFVVLCIEPHAVFMQGFYFSFIAVACLFLTQQRWRLKSYKSSLAIQLSCLIGLMPLTLHWYSYGSINGFLANLFAIPLVGFVIVPLALVTMLINTSSWAALVMHPLSWSISFLLQGLHWTEQLAAVNISYSLHSIEFTLALMGALLMWVLLPINPFRWFACLWLLLPLFPPRPNIQPGEAWVNVLDVGQGLAVSIRTQNHTLLYDTGDRFFQGSDLGKMVVLPYLDTLNIKSLDAIVISHPDKDHRGGLQSIEAAIPVKQLLVNEPRYYHHGIKCHNYPEWQWDQVRFRFLPIHAHFKNKNNNSCILQVASANGRVLLVGDVEKEAEDYLVKTYGTQLASEVLIVPHHGSKTSSSYRFLLEIAPRYAVASLGFDNRFHFPHSKTLISMNTLNIPLYRTDECGMTQFILPAQGDMKPPQCFSGIHAK
ncbi:DNA internalization-related competence protein ComEC/Rec2 [Legionella lytica]|uniref:DNA internalization-related competence protein ComEC/Rec2 n=1 Tax=Legionella lytica TaxID=96232 RepID=A0ABY4Y864_9GAMM|nr:DNA internalization-related competence protein ComEC/Rec2 [Legionella lytica]USQ13430.1 DNA internalization-related competence protein ComEC/Rec2 [Legionella lytica]